MPVYQYKGKHYDLPEGLTNEQALSKIKTHLGETSTTEAPDQSDAETQRLAGKKEVKEKPSVLQQMIGPGSPTYSAVRGGIIQPLLGINELLSKAFPEPIRKGASNLVRQETQTYEQGREQMGREGFDAYQLLGAVASPLNKLLPGGTAPTMAGRAAQGVTAGALYAGMTPTSGNEDSFVEEKLFQMGLGAVVGGAVPITVDTTKKLATTIRDLPISQAAKDRAYKKYITDLLGNDTKAAQKALKEAKEIVKGSQPTAAEALSDTPSAARLVREQQRIAKEFPERFITRGQEQQAARQAELTGTFGTPDDLAEAVAARTRETAPLRQDALKQANIYGEVAPRLEADIAERMGQPGAQKGLIGATQLRGIAQTEAAQATNRANTWTPVPGMPRFPGRYSPNMERAIELKKAASEIGDVVQQKKLEVDFKKMQLQSLKDEGFYPLEVKPLLDRIESSLKKPGEKSNALLVDAQKRIAEKLNSYADENGIINSVDLYNVRKEIGEDIQAFLASRGNPSFGAQATAVEKSLKTMLDDSITKASGSTLWKDYLTSFSKHSEKINQMQVGQALKDRLGGTYDKEAAGRFATAIKESGSLIKRSTGQSRFEKIEDVLTKDQMASVNRVYADLLRKQKAEQVAKQANVTGRVPFEAEQELPQFLSRWATVGRSILDTLRRGSQKELDNKMAEMLLDPQKLADFLETIPKKEAKGIGEALAARMSPEMRIEFSTFLSSLPPKEGEVTRGVTATMLQQ